MAGWKLNDQFGLPKDNMPAELMLETAERRYAAPAKGDVGEIAVASGHCRWAAVEGSSCPHAALEVPPQAPIMLEEAVE